jgi:hypothetical protein
MPVKFDTIHEAKQAFAMDKAMFEAKGVYFPEAVAYTTDAVKQNYQLAMDAIPAMATTTNAGVPAMLTTLIDPQVYEVLFAPQKAVEVAGEEKRGDWVDQTIMFPTVEHEAEVSSYGDYSNNGRAGLNSNWPQRQSYNFQVIKSYGDLEAERAGLAKVNYVAEANVAAASGLSRFQNKTYFYGVAGLQNYGLLNDPALPASLTPGTKAAGNGNVWTFGTAPNATANEVFADIQALVTKLVVQSNGLVDENTGMTLALSPAAAQALRYTNSFGLSARAMIEENYPNMRIVTAPQYGALSSTNPEGNAAGNLVQLIANEIEGQKSVYCAYNVKMKAFPMVRDLSSYRQKMASGTWGAVWRMPFACASMLGV